MVVMQPGDQEVATTDTAESMGSAATAAAEVATDIARDRGVPPGSAVESKSGAAIASASAARDGPVVESGPAWKAAPSATAACPAPTESSSTSVAGWGG